MGMIYSWIIGRKYGNDI